MEAGASAVHAALGGAFETAAVVAAVVFVLSRADGPTGIASLVGRVPAGEPSQLEFSLLFLASLAGLARAPVPTWFMPVTIFRLRKEHVTCCRQDNPFPIFPFPIR